MIRTKRLVLKPYADADRAGMLRLLTDECVKQTFMIPDFDTPADADAMFEKLKAWSLCDTHYEKGIYLGRQLIGFINDVELDGACIELGYVIHPAHHNKGFATEALSAAIGDLFAKGYSRVKAAAFWDNQASRRVMEKCGMRLTKQTGSVTYHGKQQECVYYAIDKDR